VLDDPLLLVLTATKTRPSLARFTLKWSSATSPPEATLSRVHDLVTAAPPGWTAK
jgi:hypothetical protein